MSIYVVDDHPIMRDAIAMVMRRLQPHRNIVEIGCLAELMPSVAATGPPGLILLDLNLPDATGCSGVHTVKRHFPSVPLAVYSASRAADVAHDCIEAGADIYIEKTAGASDLVAALRNLLFDIPLSTPQVARDQGRHQSACSTEQRESTIGASLPGASLALGSDGMTSSEPVADSNSASPLSNWTTQVHVLPSQGKRGPAQGAVHGAGISSDT